MFFEIDDIKRRHSVYYDVYNTDGWVDTPESSIRWDWTRGAIAGSIVLKTYSSRTFANIIILTCSSINLYKTVLISATLVFSIWLDKKLMLLFASPTSRSFITKFISCTSQSTQFLAIDGDKCWIDIVTIAVSLSKLYDNKLLKTL